MNSDIIYCGYCGKEIINPRVEKGKIVQKFCNRKCKAQFHNFNRYTMLRLFMDFLAKGGYLNLPPSQLKRKREGK
jgi:hypothetical protein